MFRDSSLNNEPDAPGPDAPNFSPRLYGIALLVTAIVITGVWLISRFTAVDLARDMQTWQEKLNLIAESRTAEVNNWVSGHFKELRSLSDNPSLQLYLTELQTMGSPAVSEFSKSIPPKRSPEEIEPAQKAYLRNLLLFTADRAGYGNANSSNVSAIRANVQQESKNGLAVIDNNNQIIVSTNMAASTRDMMLEQIRSLGAGKEGLIDIQKDSEGMPYIGFAVPIFSIQGERNADSQIGKVVGIQAVDANLFRLLKHPGVTEQTLESILVRSNDDKIEFISPLLDGSTALTKQTPRDTKKFAEASLIQTSGDFLNEKKDYRDKVVLGTSRNVADTPWTLIVKIDRTEALSESSQRRASMVVFFFLIIAIIVLIIVAVWWHAHSKRSMMMSRYFRRLAAWATAQEQLLRLVADHQPEPIYIIDASQTYRFANKKTADAAGMTPDHVPGKTLSDIRGAARAELIYEQCERALRTRQIGYDITHIDDGKKDAVTRSAYVPLDHIPIITLPEPTPGVLVVEQDISEVVHEREQRLDTQQQLVQTLVRLVDARDPFAANHSMLVAQIAAEIASDMELNNDTIETARTAGTLMNIGKIVVPTELLTKTDSLTAEEKIVIRDSMNLAADLTRGISFDGPVAETLRQWQEKWDGTGPHGIAGEGILITARIIAAANAFIGMISPRSWRTAIAIEAANKFMLDQCDTHFDRRVVVALINYVENHSGKKWLKDVLDAQRKAA